jgi:acyl carrier protein
MSMDITEELRAAWKEVLKVEDVDNEANFIALGGSSMTAVQLAAIVQERLAIELNAVEVVLTPKFRDVVTLLEARISGRG